MSVRTRFIASAAVGAITGAALLCALTLLEQSIAGIWIPFAPTWTEQVRTCLPGIAVLGAFLGAVAGGSLALRGPRGDRKAGLLSLLGGGVLALPLGAHTLNLASAGPTGFRLNLAVQAMLLLYGLPLFCGLLLMLWGATRLLSRRAAVGTQPAGPSRPTPGAA